MEAAMRWSRPETRKFGEGVDVAYWHSAPLFACPLFGRYRLESGCPSRTPGTAGMTLSGRRRDAAYVEGQILIFLRRSAQEKTDSFGGILADLVSQRFVPALIVRYPRQPG
jgi:hypothetical protein